MLIPAINIEDFTSKKMDDFGKWIKAFHRFLPSFNHQYHTHTENEFLEMDAELSSHFRLFDATTLLTFSDERGNITFANENFCRASKYSQDELIGRPDSFNHHPDTPASLYSELFMTVRNGKTWQGEIKNMAKDGTHYWVMTTVAPVLGEFGKPIKYISMRVDITKQKEMELELQEVKKSADLELLQNVNYAGCVHKAFLNSEEQIKTIFPSSFLIYRAQKIISGDFYRVERQKDKSVIMFGDSTGHGVSASFISHLALNIFDRTIAEGYCSPTKILNKMNDEIKHILQMNNAQKVNQSADTMVCVLDNNTKVLKYASANIKAVLIRGGEIMELAKERCSVGELVSVGKISFNNEIQLEKGDCLYIFSDGIQDQFGGPNNKKFGYRTLLSLLQENQHLSIQQQKVVISETLKAWQGENEQTDDMSMLGIKIN